MRINILTFVFILLVFQNGFGQARLATPSVDRATYEYWATQNWDELIDLGNRALKQGIDFYYLRYRMGVAWYEKKNYHMAIRHFSAAYQMSPYDEYLKEYLYYSYVYSGRDYEASYLDNTFSNRLKNRLGLTDNRAFKQVYINYSNQRGQRHRSFLSLIHHCKQKGIKPFQRDIIFSMPVWSIVWGLGYGFTMVIPIFKKTSFYTPVKMIPG